MSAQNEIIIEQPPNIPEQEKILPPTFYEKLGDDIILDLSKLINLVKSRFKLLKYIENFSHKLYILYRTIHKKIPIELSWDDEETINNDKASHFLLALIMCKTDREINWFLRQESLLYYCRIRKPKFGKPKYDMYKILSHLGLKLHLFDANNNNDNIDINKIRFRRKQSLKEKIYYIKFTEAIHLLPSRAYYLHKGNLYILEYDLPKLFIRVFQQNQKNILLKIKANAVNMEKDHRIKEIILAFQKEKEKYRIQETVKITREVKNDEKIKTMDEVDKYSERCFPLCMCLIERHLNKYSHLMHQGRLQYTLFLKSAGLPIEEAIKFFQKKFEKKTTLAQFEKNYVYYIRHAYGLEGKKTNYLPYNCDKLINMNPPMGYECHGCPFRNYSGEDLGKILVTCNLRDTDIEDILIKKSRKLYQMCCMKYFEGKFIGSSGERVSVHPNKYFTTAMRIIKGENTSQQNNNDNNNNNLDNFIANNIELNSEDNINELDEENIIEEEKENNSDDDDDTNIELDLDLVELFGDDL